MYWQWLYRSSPPRLPQSSPCSDRSRAPKCLDQPSRAPDACTCQRRSGAIDRVEQPPVGPGDDRRVDRRGKLLQADPGWRTSSIARHMPSCRQQVVGLLGHRLDAAESHGRGSPRVASLQASAMLAQSQRVGHRQHRSVGEPEGGHQLRVLAHRLGDRKGEEADGLLGQSHRRGAGGGQLEPEVGVQPLPLRCRRAAAPAGAGPLVRLDVDLATVVRAVLSPSQPGEHRTVLDDGQRWRPGLQPRTGQTGGSPPETRRSCLGSPAEHLAVPGPPHPSECLRFGQRPAPAPCPQRSGRFAGPRRRRSTGPPAPMRRGKLSITRRTEPSGCRVMTSAWVAMRSAPRDTNWGGSPGIHPEGTGSETRTTSSNGASRS